LNINFPSLDIDDIAGVAITKLGTRMFTSNYDKRIDPRGKVYYWLAGELIEYDENDGTDINALRMNKISITPITFQMTAKEIMPELEKAFCDENCDWF
jgi:5'-nucleotidase